MFNEPEPEEEKSEAIIIETIKEIRKMPQESLALIPAYLKYIMPMVEFKE